MKKKTWFWGLILILISLVLMGCSLFESEPINPRIIGTGLVQEKDNTFSVSFGGKQYQVDEVYFAKGETLTPTKGMQVTCFVYPKVQRVAFVLGSCNERQIEEMFYTNEIAVFVLACLMVLAFFFLLRMKAPPKAQVVYAD